ncbi:MAG: translation initiation factor [Pseudanabaenaceae cyanobacterium]|jgi:translation initiation factor 1
MGKNRVVYREFGDDPQSEEPSVHSDVPPQQQNHVRVQLSRKGRGGKTVTVITGLQHTEPTLTDLAKKIKAQCGTGGTVKDGEIEIQGDHRQKIVEYLQKLGYKAKAAGG